MHILFVCTGNSCRSQMAEGWLRHLAGELVPQLGLKASSAGMAAHGVNPMAIRCMQEQGMDISNHRSKLLTDAMIEQADLVVTVCADADSSCPVVPAGKKKLHLPFDDPAQAEGSEQEVIDCFRRVCSEIGIAMGNLVQELKCTGAGTRPGFNRDDVRILDRTIDYDSFLRVDRLTLQHRLFAGGWSRSLSREVLVRTAAVGVLLCDPVRRELVLVKQFRVGLLDDSESPWSLELVAGLVETGESPEQVAYREVTEETGLQAGRLIRICEYFNSPGASTEKVTLFCARVDANEAGGVHGLKQEQEDIQTVVLPERELNQSMLMQNGTSNNAMSLIALQWWLANRDSILAGWAGGPESADTDRQPESDP